MNKHYSIVMSDDDIELFENGVASENMSKSAYVRLLIAEHENRLPPFYKYREIISRLSNIENQVNAIVLNDKFDSSDRLALFDKMDEVVSVVKDFASK